MLLLRRAQPSGHLLGPGPRPWGQSRGFQEHGRSQPLELSGATSRRALEESSTPLTPAGGGHYQRSTVKWLVCVTVVTQLCKVSTWEF